MTASTPEADIRALIAKLDGIDTMRVSVIDGEVILEGCVPDYATKRRIETSAIAVGLRVQNCLRVLPGAIVQIESSRLL